MNGWETLRSDGYGQLYQRKVAGAVLTVWAGIDPDEIGPALFEFHWTISRDADDFTMTSKRTFWKSEEAAEAAEKKLMELERT